MEWKKLGCLVLAWIPALTMAQSNPAEKTCTISGVITGANDHTIYLISSMEVNPKDSLVIRDGKFRFTMPADTTLYALLLEGSTTPMLVIALPGETRITADAGTYPLGKVMDSRENEAMQAYQSDFRALTDEATSLNRQAQGISEADTVAIQAFRLKAEIFNTRVKTTGERFIEGHRDDMASLFVLMNEMRSRLQPQELVKTFGELAPSVRDSKFGIAAKQYIKEVNFNAVGDLAPDFTENDTLGRPVSLASFRGRYVLVDFWASWCNPCRAENPNLVAAYQIFRDKNFTILSISLDDQRENWLKAIHQDGLYWTQVSDLQRWNNAVAIQYRVTSIPSNLLIGPDGRILAKNIRGQNLFNTLQSVLK